MALKKAKTHEAKENTFPYAASGPASNIDGSLGDSAEGTDNAVNSPDALEATYSTRGTILPAQIGNTDYIDTNTINHGVFAGNS